MVKFICAYLGVLFVLNHYDLVSGRGFRLYPHDKERVLNFLNLCRADEDPYRQKIEWDETFNLENAAGLEANCDMIGSSIESWGWTTISKFSGHLKYFLKTKKTPNGLFGYTATTPGDPWSQQWQDLKTIMATAWKEDTDIALPLIIGADKVGCSVLPSCPLSGNPSSKMTVLVCIFSPGNGQLDMDAGPDPGRGDTRLGKR